MVFTQLEGTVSPENWERLKAAFSKALQQMPSQIHQSYLIQDTTDENTWRVVTIWKSRDALQEYRQSVDIPEGVLMFREAGAEPTLAICKVVSHV